MKGTLLAACCVGCVAALLTTSSTAAAQGGTPGAIAGVARDATGGVLPGVTVEAASPALIEKVRSAITDEQGQYRIIDLRPGVYTVTFTLPGFSTVRRENIEITAAFTANVNGDLRVGGLEETITVSGAGPTVDVQNTVQKRAITTEVINALPSGRTFQSLGQLIPGVTRTDGNDVGGTSGERFASLAIHGSKPGDMPLIFDGMRYNNMNGSGGGGLTVFMINTGNVEEMSVQTGGGGAENQVSGVFVNVIPKSGGNSVKGTLFANYAPGNLQAHNLSDDLRARGLTNVTTIDRIWDVNPAVGGPLRTDRIWFFSAVRYWGNATNVEGIWINKTLNTPFYTPDLTKPGKDGDTKNASENVRLTFQATQKHRLSVYYDIQQRNVERRNLSPTTAPESTERLVTPRNYFTQVTWNWPITSTLLFEAGNTAYISSFTANRRARSAAVDDRVPGTGDRPALRRHVEPRDVRGCERRVEPEGDAVLRDRRSRDQGRPADDRRDSHALQLRESQSVRAGAERRAAHADGLGRSVDDGGEADAVAVDLRAGPVDRPPPDAELRRPLRLPECLHPRAAPAGGGVRRRARLRTGEERAELGRSLAAHGRVVRPLRHGQDGAQGEPQSLRGEPDGRSREPRQSDRHIRDQRQPFVDRRQWRLQSGLRLQESRRQRRVRSDLEPQLRQQQPERHGLRAGHAARIPEAAVQTGRGWSACSTS
ncbi:MAG: carboxypeptidase regulatory-like domain-containing protein [Vicinamibacterales bacterium]